MDEQRPALVRIAWPVEILLGALFLLGAVLKAADVRLFAVQITYYGVIQSENLVELIAIGTIALEAVLGLALVSGLRLRGWVLATVAALLIAFTGLVGYGWAYHGLEDCGCFGAIKMSPPVSIVKNFVMLAMAVAAWLGITKTAALKGQGAPISDVPFLPRTLRLAVCAVAAVFLLYHGFSILGSVPEQASTQERGEFALVPLAEGNEQELLDVGDGAYLLAIMSSTCDDCMASVPDVNTIATNAEAPTVVGLMEGTEEEFTAFVRRAAPEFDTHLVDSLWWFRQINEHPPRFVLIHNGYQLGAWDESVPQVEEISELTHGLEGSKAPPEAA
jgi:methylamine utilization protein MauE